MTTDSSSEALPRPITLAGQSLPPLPKVPYLLKGFDPRGEPLAATILPPASTLGMAEVEQSPLCLAPPAPTQRPAPQASTLKTIKIILNKSPPASTIRLATLLPPASTSYGRGGSVTPTICPATLLPPKSNLGPAEVEQSPPCRSLPAPKQRPAPHALTLNTIKITLKTSPPA